MGNILCRNLQSKHCSGTWRPQHLNQSWPAKMQMWRQTMQPWKCQWCAGFVAHLPKYQLLAFLRSRSRSPRLWKKGATSQTWRLRVACRVHMRARALCGGRHCWKAAGTVAVTVTFRIQWCKLGMTSHISSSPLARCADAIRQHQWGKDLFFKETETPQ